MGWGGAGKPRPEEITVAPQRNRIARDITVHWRPQSIRARSDIRRSIRAVDSESTARGLEIARAARRPSTGLVLRKTITIANFNQTRWEPDMAAGAKWQVGCWVRGGGRLLPRAVSLCRISVGGTWEVKERRLGRGDADGGGQWWCWWRSLKIILSRREPAPRPE